MVQVTSLKLHPEYKSSLVTMLVARLQTSGKRSVAEKIIFDALQHVEKKTRRPALVVLETAIRKLMPEVSLVSQRVGASVYRIPRSILTAVSIPLALRWLIDSAKSKKSKTISEALALEIIDSYMGQGTAVSKAQQNKRMAAANLVYAHLGQRRKRRTNRIGIKIFTSRLESKEEQSVKKLSRIRKQTTHKSQSKLIEDGLPKNPWYFDSPD